MKFLVFVPGRRGGSMKRICREELYIPQIGSGCAVTMSAVEIRKMVKSWIAGVETILVVFVE